MFVVVIRQKEGVLFLEIGQKIKNARIEKGMTQEQLGKIVGVQKSAIAKYESGRVINIKRSTLQKIAKVLDIRPSELIFDNSPVEAAEFHSTILTDYELLKSLKDYYDLSNDDKKMIRELIHKLNQKN